VRRDGQYRSSKLRSVRNEAAADQHEVGVRRSRIIAVAVMLGVLGAALPITAALYISWTLAIDAEQDRLRSFADRTIVRANRSLAEVRNALQTISQSAVEGCSPQHIAQMRKLSFNTPSVEEIGYFEHGLLACTSWGKTEERIPQEPGDFTTADGIEVSIRMAPLVTHGKPSMALQYGAYNALVDPLRFVDVIVDPGIQLAIATDKGALISELNTTNADLMKSIIAQPRSGSNATELFAVAHGDGWMALAVETRQGMLENLRREQRLLLPIGAFIAMFIVAIVVWLSRRRLSPLGELAIAIKNREFVVHYQPIIELRSGICIGGEALVRWRRPDGSLVRPDLFIPLAEESGLIIPITDQVVAGVISDLGKELVADRSLHVAINLSAADIKTGRVLPIIKNALDEAGIDARQIWLEATERGFMDIDQAKATIILARQLGHPVAIDDFGTGYSSLQYLQGLPLDVLKIDKSFVDTIGTNAATSSVVSHIIDMAKTLDLRIVAEGVETELQARYLLGREVDFVQGWLFSKPLPASDFIAFYRRSREGRAVARLLEGVAA
jgi:sensor c-di-GMP phosphodiesterase-like protein